MVSFEIESLQVSILSLFTKLQNVHFTTAQVLQSPICGEVQTPKGRVQRCRFAAVQAALGQCWCSLSVMGIKGCENALQAFGWLDQLPLPHPVHRTLSPSSFRKAW